MEAWSGRGISVMGVHSGHFTGSVKNSVTAEAWPLAEAGVPLALVITTPRHQCRQGCACRQSYLSGQPTRGGEAPTA